MVSSTHTTKHQFATKQIDGDERHDKKKEDYQHAKITQVLKTVLNAAKEGVHGRP